MRAKAAIVAPAVLLKSVSAHFSFIDIRSQIACDFYAEDGQNWLPQPILEGASYSQWWMHGQVNCQSNAKGSFALPANGATHIVMSSRVKKVPQPYSKGKDIVQQLSWDVHGWNKYLPSNPDNVITEEDWVKKHDTHGQTVDISRGNTIDGHHNIHAYTRSDTSGCALAIAYKNDATNVRPRDFVIFSVIHDCPKRQRESISVPNLPACPNV